MKSATILLALTFALGVGSAGCGGESEAEADSSDSLNAYRDDGWFIPAMGSLTGYNDDGWFYPRGSLDGYNDDGWFIPRDALAGYNDDGWFLPLVALRVMQRSVVEPAGGDPRLTRARLIRLEDALDLLERSGSRSAPTISQALRGRSSVVVVNEHPAIGAWIFVVRLLSVATVGRADSSCRSGTVGQTSGDFCVSMESDCAQPLAHCPDRSTFGSAVNDALELRDFSFNAELPVWESWRATR